MGCNLIRKQCFLAIILHFYCKQMNIGLWPELTTILFTWITTATWNCNTVTLFGRKVQYSAHNQGDGVKITPFDGYIYSWLKTIVLCESKHQLCKRYTPNALLSNGRNIILYAPIRIAGITLETVTNHTYKNTIATFCCITTLRLYQRRICVNRMLRMSVPF